MSVSIHAYDAFNLLFDSGIGLLVKTGAVMGLVALIGVGLKKLYVNHGVGWAAIGLVTVIGLGIASAKAIQSI